MAGVCSAHQFQHGTDQVVGAFADLIDAGVEHVTGGGNDLAFAVDGDFTLHGRLMPCTHGGEIVGGSLILTDGQGDVAQDLGQDHRGDAEGADRFAGTVHGLDRRGHVGVDRAVGAIEGITAQVLGGAEAAGDDQAVGRVGGKGGQGGNLAPGDAGRFDQDIAFFVHFLTGDVIEHMVLLDVGRIALKVGTVLVNGPKGQGGLVDFGAVLMAAS